MKCPSCERENPEKATLCRFCGKPLKVSRDNLGPGGEFPRRVEIPGREMFSPKGLKSQQAVDHRSILDKVKFDYSHGVRDHTQKALEGVQNLLSNLQSPKVDIEKMFNEAAQLIWRQFGIDNVAIGLRSKEDGLYRYKVMAGFREDALAAHKKIVYKKEQFFDSTEFHGVKISKYSTMYMAENNILTEAEKEAYNRPGLLAQSRKDLTDSLEGDYIDVGIYGRNDDLVGWIEISGTRTMKLPDVTTIRWVEVIASILAAALACSERD